MNTYSVYYRNPWARDPHKLRSLPVTAATPADAAYYRSRQGLDVTEVESNGKTYAVIAACTACGRPLLTDLYCLIGDDRYCYRCALAEYHMRHDLPF